MAASDCDLPPERGLKRPLSASQLMPWLQDVVTTGRFCRLAMILRQAFRIPATVSLSDLLMPAERLDDCETLRRLLLAGPRVSPDPHRLLDLSCQLIDLINGGLARLNGLSVTDPLRRAQQRLRCLADILMQLFRLDRNGVELAGCLLPIAAVDNETVLCQWLLIQWPAMAWQDPEPALVRQSVVRLGAALARLPVNGH